MTMSTRKLLVAASAVHTLFVIRPDGTGRAEVHPDELPLPPGGIPDWGP